MLVYYKSSAGRRVANAGQVRKNDIVVLDDFLVEVADQGNRNFFLLGPGLLGERRVNTDADDGGVEASVLAHPGADFTHLLGADPGEGGGEKKKDGVFLAVIIAELDIHQPGGGFGLQSEVRRF